MRIWRPGDDLALLTEAYEIGVPIAIPTESSYGLGVDPWNAEAVERVFQLKSRSKGMPLPVVVGSVAGLAQLGVVADQPILSWAEDRWPAALSVILGVERTLPAGAGRMDLAVRIPDDELLRNLLDSLGPLTATSANSSGASPLLSVEQVKEWIGGRNAVVIDGGDLPGGPPSTLVSEEDGKLNVLRQGRYPVTAEDRL